MHFKNAQLIHWGLVYLIFYLQNFPRLHSGYLPHIHTDMPAGCDLLSFSEVMECGALMSMVSSC